MTTRLANPSATVDCLTSSPIIYWLNDPIKIGSSVELDLSPLNNKRFTKSFTISPKMLRDSDLEETPFTDSSVNDSDAQTQSSGVDSDVTEPSDNIYVNSSDEDISSWGSSDPPDSQDFSEDTEIRPHWEKDPSYSDDSSLLSEDYENDSDSSFLGDHLHVYPEKNPVPSKPALEDTIAKDS